MNGNIAEIFQYFSSVSKMWFQLVFSVLKFVLNDIRQYFWRKSNQIFICLDRYDRYLFICIFEKLPSESIFSWWLIHAFILFRGKEFFGYSKKDIFGRSSYVLAHRQDLQHLRCKHSESTHLIISSSVLLCGNISVFTVVLIDYSFQEVLAFVLAVQYDVSFGQSVFSFFSMSFLVVESLDSRSPSEMPLLPHLYKVFRWNRISYKFYLTDFTAKRKTYFFMF